MDGDLYDHSSYQDRKQSDKKVNKPALIALIIAIAIIAIINRSGSSKTQYSTRNKNDYNTAFNAKYMAREVVKEYLKAPSTAKFCDYDEMTVQNPHHQEWIISGYVDSQNSFGAMLRKKFVVTLTLTESGCKNYEAMFFDR